LQQYDSRDSFVSTLKKNDQYVMQITKYIDTARIYPGSAPGEVEIVYGPQLAYEKCTTEDIAILKENNPQANFYPSYFFNKNFQDFTDEFIYTDSTRFLYEAISFREAVVIDDYGTFYQKVIFGGKPIAANEVLIYDYMAYSLLYHNVFSGQIADVVGKVLTDKQTGLSIRISGILKSDYERYAYIKNRNGDFSFEETYLTGLQTLFCKSDLVSMLVNDARYLSVLKYFFVKSDDLQETNVKKLKFISLSEVSELNFLVAVKDYQNEEGVILSKKQVADILGLSNEEFITEQVAKEFMDDYRMDGYEAHYDWSIERTLYGYRPFRVLGIVDDNGDEGALPEEDGVITVYSYNEDYYFWCNTANFRQIYLSLAQDWSVNKAILNNFIMRGMSGDFYNENPAYYFEGYTDFTAYGVLISNADFYLVKVKNLAADIMIVLIIVACAGMLFFTFMTVKKYGYKIGVLKSLGAKNSDIILVFGLQLVVITLFAFLLSIPICYILMSSINNGFVKEINSSLTFFFINPINIVYIFLISLGAIVVSTLIPLFKLTFSSPVTIIRNNGPK